MTTQPRARVGNALSFTTFVDLGIVLLILLAGTVHFIPAWGGAIGPVAAGVGAAVGLTLGWIATAGRWGPLATLLAALIAHLGLAPWVLPDVGSGLQALANTTTASLSVWRDALTLAPPLTVFTGMTVLPWLTGLVAGLLATRLVLSGYPHAGGLATLMLPLVAIIWGVREPFYPALSCPPLVAALVLLWAVHAHRRRRGSIAESLEVDNEGVVRSDYRSGFLGLSVVAVAVTVAIALAPAAPTPRILLRDEFTPPLDPAEYATPLSLVRTLETEMVDTHLMDVRDAPSGMRLRIAAMDSYDGTAVSVSEDATGVARFKPVGEGTVLDDIDPATVRTVRLLLKDYSFPWVPTVSRTRTVWVSGEREELLGSSLYYDSLSSTLLTTEGTAAGDVLTEEVAPARIPSDSELSSLEVDTNVPGKVVEVPALIAAQATTIVGSESTALGKVRALQQTLRAGYYSDGTKSPSAPGHSAFRLSSMAQDNALIGDAEQYSVLMMIMCRSVGVPARVVMGFDPSIDGNDKQVTGTDVTAWVEVPFKGVGWVPFDVTPNRDQVPQQQTDERVSNPLPQVLQPPLSLQEPAELPPTYEEDPEDNDKDEPDHPTSNLGLYLAVAGVPFLLLLPFALVVGAKAWRRRRRRRLRAPVERVEGAWDEVLDRARDLGVSLAAGRTRRETASELDTQFPDAGLLPLSRDVDESVFGRNDPADEDAAAVWRATEASIPAMGSGRSRFQRALARVSLASLTHPAARTSRGRRTTRRDPR